MLSSALSKNELRVRRHGDRNAYTRAKKEGLDDADEESFFPTAAASHETAGGAGEAAKEKDAEVSGQQKEPAQVLAGVDQQEKEESK